MGFSEKMEELTLTQREFKALSSEKRTQIIKMLKGRNYTLAEFSKHLNLAPPTIKQHLELLIESDIIELEDSGHKWKYYRLTKKGKKLTESEENKTTLLIALAISVVSMVGIAMLLASNLGLSSKIGAVKVQEAQMPAKQLAVSQPQIQKAVADKEAEEAVATPKSVKPIQEETAMKITKEATDKVVEEPILTSTEQAKVTSRISEPEKEEKAAQLPKAAPMPSSEIAQAGAAKGTNAIAIAVYLIAIVALLLVSANIAKKLFGRAKL